MTILHISYTHNLHPLLAELPAADVIVHSGDFTMHGTEEEALDFINWFCDLPYKHKIFVVGNQDALAICLWNAMGIEGLPDNCHLLQDEFVVIDGVRFYGVSCYNTIVPAGVDVLISHEPPFGILDMVGNTHWGNAKLAKDLALTTAEQIAAQHSGARIQNRPPRFHLFGHAHASFGKKTIDSTTFLNSACVDEDYALAVLTGKDFQLFSI